MHTFEPMWTGDNPKVVQSFMPMLSGYKFLTTTIVLLILAPGSVLAGQTL